MSVFYVDSSAWVKYYVDELGSDWMAEFWAEPRNCACSVLGVVEVTAALVRRYRHAQGATDELLRYVEDVASQYDGFLAVEMVPAVLALGRELVVRHGLRGADGIHLASAVHLRQVLGRPVVFVASDEELLAAAAMESMETLDPQTSPPMPSV